MKVPRKTLILDLMLMVAALVLVACGTPESRSGADDGSQIEQEHAVRTVDVSQALLMLDFLERVSQRNHEPEHLEAVMESEGTELIVAQMNLARRTSKDQYRQLLVGLANGQLPELEPVDSSERARNGVRGLTGNVWPILNWGLDRTDVLRQRVEHLDRLDFYEQAVGKAMSFLPEHEAISPRVFAVIGGRAGGAELSEERIYIDVLVFSFRDRREQGYPTDTELINTIAHEMHHVGYGRFLSRVAQNASLDDQGRLILRFVSELLMEGSATYLISEDRNIDRMRAKRSYSDILEDESGLLAATEDIISSILNGELDSPEEYEDVTAELLGNWFHSTGSYMLSVIDEAVGLEMIRQVLAEPTRLLFEYNQAAHSMSSDSPVYHFDDMVAERVLRIGHSY
jgi:hypothetical protein